MQDDALARLDREDPLAACRARFRLPEGVIYLDGNSLGALPATTPAAVARAVEAEWGRDLIKSWNSAGWIDLWQRIAADLAAVVGAAPGTIAVGDSISVNLFKLLATATRLRPGRPVILADTRNFPTDLYVAQGLAALLGDRVRLRLVDAPEALAAALDDGTALVMASHVDYRSGQLLDLAGLTRAAQSAGALMLVDLAHSAGVVPVELERHGVDMAVGCGYKFLNGGPGAPAFIYLAERHQAAAFQPIAGWFGHAEPFAFAADYRPADGIRRFLAGTPPVLSMVALREGVALAAEAGIEPVREKAMRLTEVFLELFEARLEGQGFTLVSPRDPARRGAQLSFSHAHGYAVMQALIAAGVIGDFRAPDIVRFGFAPLYLGFADMALAVARIERVMREERWREPRYQIRGKVT